ncbi:hypothetical protein T484DRAFT_1841093 [Baffinella frigidus]|nr:hypothetical protein T484DRAFT_1841093 [Cryptophyta sp. CCMP2293]
MADHDIGPPRMDVIPSRVLHIRNLPEEVTDADLRSMAAPYGQPQCLLPIRRNCRAAQQGGDNLLLMSRFPQAVKVVKMLLMSRKHQGFVEFSTLEKTGRMRAPP